MSYTMSRTVDITMNLEVLENLRLELRRGCLIVAVLAQLRREQYGYTLRKSLADNGLVIDEGTLYPLLRRLETQGLLASEWREQDKRNKRFYRLSPEGGLILTQLLADWGTMNSSLEASDLRPKVCWPANGGSRTNAISASTGCRPREDSS